MRPLQSLGMGLVIVALRPELGGYDALPDPFGWLLVLLGVRALPDDLPRRGALLITAGVATAASVPLWLPAVTSTLLETHPSLLWAANLPQLGFAALLCHTLAARAGDAQDRAAAAWLRLVMTGFVAFALLPVLVFGAGVASLELPSYVGAALAMVILIWLLFAYASRPWAVAGRTVPE